MNDPATGPLAAMPHLPDPVWLLFAKAIGAAAGSAVSIAYVLPRGRREAALRFAIGMVAGLVFGSTVGLKLVDEIGLSDRITAFETTLTGATIASLCAWWGLGILSRLFERAAK